MSATVANANMEVETKTIKLSLILHVGSADAAMSQVVFRRAEDQAAFEQRVSTEVDKRTAALKAEVEKKETELGLQINDRAEKEITNRMLKRYGDQELGAIARSSDNVIVRFERAIVIGDQAYLGFQIQNRSTSPYRLKTVSVHQGAATVDARVSLDASTTSDDGASLVGVVGGGAHAMGVVVVDTTKLARGPVAARFLDDKDGTLDVGGLQVP
jgi:hypothetical protein